MYHFTSFVWGCRHAGMSGQRLSNAVSEIHRNLSKKSTGVPYNILNYSDDMAGAELNFNTALSSFNKLSEILASLGLSEALDKAISPSTQILYLGVEFDTLKMEMRIGLDKCTELKNELCSWCRRTTATKQELQSILGKLMWVSRAVKFSRTFGGLILWKFLMALNL